MNDVPTPAVDEVELRLRWQPTGDGALDGHLDVRNIGRRVVRVSGKPVVTPIGQDGRPLETEFVITAELRMPPYVDLAPGQRATAPVSWAGWDGPPASGQVRVELDGITVDMVAEGPSQPAGRAEPMNLSSSWFDLLDE